jgi:hypothetical protein
MGLNSPASGSPSFRNTNVLFLSWSIIAIFVGVLRYILSTFTIKRVIKGATNIYLNKMTVKNPKHAHSNKY